MTTLDDINPAVLTGQGLPDSNPFKVVEEAGEETPVDAIAERKIKKVKKILSQTDYLEDLLKKAEDPDGDDVPTDDGDL